MPAKHRQKSTGLFKSVMTAHFILVLHMLLIVALGLLILFFRGIVVYMPWIFLLGAAGIAVSGYLFYRRMKREKKSLREMLASPPFRGRTVEISFLGGLASFRIGGPGRSVPGLDTTVSPETRQLEDPDGVRIRELNELVRMLENDLLTLEEFNRVKRRLLK